MSLFAIVRSPNDFEATHHRAPDELPDETSVTAYCLEELFAEKIRALHERMRPRDLYDVVQLVDNYAQVIDFSAARTLFRAKCSAKGIATPTTAALLAQVSASAELEADWGEMLGHQLPALPPLDGIRLRLLAAFAWIDEPAHFLADAPAVATVPIAVPPAPLARVSTREDEAPVAPAGVTFWGAEGPLELVRFAGANRLMVAFTYHGVQRTVEPYSLRRAGTGNLLLYAWEEAAGHVKAFKAAEMSGLAVTERTFVPRYSIELSGIAVSPVRAWRPAPRSSGLASFGQTYVFQCPHCQKTFRHTHNDPSLRAHKRTDGYGNCPGRRGYLLRIE
jgi:hypothetical protein